MTSAFLCYLDGEPEMEALYLVVGGQNGRQLDLGDGALARAVSGRHVGKVGFPVARVVLGRPVNSVVKVRAVLSYKLLNNLL